MDHEVAILRESLKDTVWVLNQEIFDAMSKLKKPTEETVYIAENFLCVLKQKQTSWKAFQVL